MADRTPITQLKGIGEKTAKLFAKLGIFCIEDLLLYFPRDYETYREPLSIAQTPTGSINAVMGTVSTTPVVKKVRNLTILTVLIKDASRSGQGAMQMTFFNMPFLKNVLKPGSTFVFRGQVQAKGAAKVMEQPKMFAPAEYFDLLRFIQPRYALTKGLTNQTVQKAVKQIFENFDSQIGLINEDYYPEYMKGEYRLISYKEAIKGIHFPENTEQLLAARRRLVFDEFFRFLFFLRQNKEQTEKLVNEYPMIETADTVRFLEQLPYSLTKAQKKVWAQIRSDLNSPYCMNRLIQGDVGSGKTIIALLALLECAANGFQGALMAPTEVLAAQHYESVCEFIEKYHIGFKPVLLVGSMTAKEKKLIYEQIEKGEVNLIIGTHAVIQEKVIFKNLALVVTDEQHRFGVRQREKLAEKGHDPHVLVMSATPIPRTLAIILYGDLQVSIIDELPANRLPIKNCVVNTSYRPKAYEFIAKEVRSGRQAYVICPMVEEGESETMENVVEYTEKLKAALPADIQIAYLHGKMKPADKNRIMEDFSRKNIDVLVSTTVIEVGINVPNATVMMVENSERFGLAQLHQLRGRVGRGEYQSYCIFINTNESKESTARLDILNKSNDGFYIANEDLKLRGPGDLFGIRQSGEFAFHIGDVFQDADVLQLASEAVERVCNGYLKPEEYDAFVSTIQSINGNVINFRSI